VAGRILGDMSDAPADAPRLSVIVAAWNAAATIRAALASVLDQREVSLEAIVVDDGSTDGTAAIVAELASADPRIVPIALAVNGGVSAARNAALEVARGEWVAFLDADDRLLPGGLAAMLRAGDDSAPTAAGDADGASPIRVVVGQRVSTDGERTWFPRLYDLPDIRVQGRKSLAANPGLLYYAGPVGKLFHRSLAVSLRFEGRMLGDQPWVLRAMIRAGDGILVITDTVYEWRRPHPDRYIATITSARERSATLGAEAVGMASVAFATVHEELVSAYDPAVAARLGAEYVARLVRSELGPQVRGAVIRRDPGLPALFDALRGFLSGLPAGAAAGSDAVAAVLLRPPADRWHLVSAPARAAYWSLVAAATRVDPVVVRRIPGRTLRALVEIAVSGPGLRRRLASGLLVGRALAGAAARRLLGLRRGRGSGESPG
jgi:hypothetical protein